jgi:hypothetical protein
MYSEETFMQISFRTIPEAFATLHERGITNLSFKNAVWSIGMAFIGNYRGIKRIFQNPSQTTFGQRKAKFDQHHG